MTLTRLCFLPRATSAQLDNWLASSQGLGLYSLSGGVPMVLSSKTAGVRGRFKACLRGVCQEFCVNSFARPVFPVSPCRRPDNRTPRILGSWARCADRTSAGCGSSSSCRSTRCPRFPYSSVTHGHRALGAACSFRTDLPPGRRRRHLSDQRSRGTNPRRRPRPPQTIRSRLKMPAQL